MITGTLAGTVSRWFSDAYPEAPSVEAAALLEAKVGFPAYAGVFAALTGHRLVTMADDEAGTGAAPHVFAASAYRACATLHEIHADGRVNRAEAKAMLADLGELSRLVSDLSAAMARLAEG